MALDLVPVDELPPIDSDASGPIKTAADYVGGANTPTPDDEDLEDFEELDEELPASEDEHEDSEDESHQDFLLRQAKELGIVLDEKSYEGVEFDEESVKQEFKRIAAISALRSHDPVMAKLYENGMSVSQYVERSASIQRIISMPDAELAKFSLYNAVALEMFENGDIDAPEGGDLSKLPSEALAAIDKETNERFAKLSDKAKLARANKLRQEQERYLKELPETYAKQSEEEAEKEWQKTMVPQVKKLCADVLQKDLAYELEKEGLAYNPESFSKYLADALSGVKTEDGKVGHKFFQDLAKDREKFFKVLLASHLLETGDFKSQYKKSVNAAYKKTFGLPKAPSNKNAESKGSKSLNNKGVRTADNYYSF